MELLLPAQLLSARMAAQAAIDFDPTEGERLGIVLTEIVTNIVRHGWRGRPSDHIELTIQHDPAGSSVIATVRYPGLPFDWLIPAHTAEAMIEPLRTDGGLGLLLIHSIADDVASGSDGQWQELTIVRRLRQRILERPVERRAA
jgi:anti-sigma regulatory factor (Ser/Thr protein kinase)